MEEKQFFFEKKNQKTFASWARASGKNRDSDTKVFCFISSEKKNLPSLTTQQPGGSCNLKT
jgi:hypothetical protein